MLGGFYSKQKVHDFYSSEAPFLLEEVNYGRALRGLPPCADLPACFFGVGYYNGVYALILDGHLEDTQSAVFAQVDFRLLERLKLTAGARYAKYDFEQVQFRAGTVIVSNGATVLLEQSDDPVTPKFGVSYQMDDDNLFYANASKGYRIGGAATPVGARCAADAAALGFDPSAIRSIKPDTVWSYEAGRSGPSTGACSSTPPCTTSTGRTCRPSWHCRAAAFRRRSTSARRAARGGPRGAAAGQRPSGARSGHRLQRLGVHDETRARVA